jgi:hypothetical protein
LTIASAFREVISPPGGLSPYVPNEGAPVIITELTGQKRQVVLRGRALPFRGPEFGISQRSRVTYYTGNPIGTQQLFGPTFDPTTFTGIWRDKYLQPDPSTGQAAVTVRGFPQPTTAEAMVGIINELILSGSDLEVQWSMFRRFGIVKRFTPSPDRTEDQPWSLEFEWHSDGTQPPEQTTLQTLDPNKIESAMSQLSDLVAFDPIDTILSYEARIFSLIDQIQTQVDDVLTKCRVLANAITLPTRVVQGIRGAATSVAFLVGQLLTEVLENGYTVAMTDDGVAGIFTMEAFKRDVGTFAGILRDSVNQAAQSLESRAEPDALRIVTMDGSGSLRVLAQQEYGNADAWQLIADANGFDSSSIPPGTQVIIPPAPGLTGVT